MPALCDLAFFPSRTHQRLGKRSVVLDVHEANGLPRLTAESVRTAFLNDGSESHIGLLCHNDPIDFTDPMGFEINYAQTGPPISGNHVTQAMEVDEAYNKIMADAQWRNSGAIAAGMAGYQDYQAWSAQQAMASLVHDPTINGKQYDASRNYGALGRATGIKAEEQLQQNPGAGEYLSYIGKKEDDFIASQPVPQHAGALVNFSDVYNKRADPSGKNDPLRGTGYRTVAGVVAQKLYTPAGISGHDLREFHRAGLDGWVAVPPPHGRPSIGISVRFHDEHNVYGPDAY